MQYPEISYLNHFDGARDVASPAKRLDAIRGRAQELRDELLAGPKVLFYETFDLIRVPYPTKYGFLNACSVPTPFLHIVNKMFVIQVNSVAGVKTVLVSPSDTVGNAETPFFKRLSPGSGGLSKVAKRFLAPELRWGRSKSQVARSCASGHRLYHLRSSSHSGPSKMARKSRSPGALSECKATGDEARMDIDQGLAAAAA